ncbi:MAG: hypothetical protein HOP19_09560, partial [Acidobacteria bacterium]|nr:hypothetical protein [Acidobacteriota bacterium]
MFNIQKAVSRLPFAPPLKEIAVTDVKIGRGDFTPKPAVPVSFAALKIGLKKAGYTLASAEITVAGELTRTGAQWMLLAEQSKQRFLLELPPGGASLVEASAHSEIIGAWKTVGNQEVIVLPASSSGGEAAKPAPAKPPELIDLISAETVSGGALAAALMPIRTTSPGLTVYRGGAVSTRYSLVRQSLGGLRVTRQIVNLAVSYTPTSQLQLAAELPISRTAFSDSRQKNTGAGVGNLTLWGKYRFYRVVGEWGDRQAAARFGLEVPIGSKGAPSQQQLNASAFVRQQLTPINGGWSPRFDLAYSQAKGRMIFGGNAEAILRSARDGYRLGHEAHFN